MLAKFNRFIRKLSIPLNILNILVGLLMGIAHVYLPFTSILGLVLGILMALSGSITMGISYWFTTKNTEARPTVSEDERLPRQNTRESNLFLAMAAPMLILNTAGSFFGMYTGTLLLAAALGFAISPPVTIAIAVTLSCVMAVGTLINSWLQTHYIWETLRRKMMPRSVRQEMLSPSPSPSRSPRQAQEIENKPSIVCELKDNPRYPEAVSLVPQEHRKKFTAFGLFHGPSSPREIEMVPLRQSEPSGYGFIHS